MCVIRSLVEEQVVDDHAVHCGEARRHVVRVGIGLENVFALDVDCAEGAIQCGIEHVGDAQARFGIERDAPVVLEQRAGGRVGNVAIARKLVREGAHVAGALHIVLPAQGVHADAGAADVAGRHGEVGDGHYGGAALRMFGDAEAIIDRGVASGGIEPGGGSQAFGRNAGDGSSSTSGLCFGSATKRAQS